jgi:hypothetical protein
MGKCVIFASKLKWKICELLKYSRLKNCLCHLVWDTLFFVEKVRLQRKWAFATKSHDVIFPIDPYSTYKIWIEGILGDGTRTEASEPFLANTDVDQVSILWIGILVEKFADKLVEYLANFYPKFRDKYIADTIDEIIGFHGTKMP